MKRDMNLVRLILLAVEKQGFEDSGYIELQGYDRQTISYHIMLLDEARLLKGIDQSSNQDLYWFAERLTWAGYEFLEAARDEKTWNKTMLTVAEKTGGLAFEVIKQVLVQFAMATVFPHP